MKYTYIIDLTTYSSNIFFHIFLYFTLEDTNFEKEKKTHQVTSRHD